MPVKFKESQKVVVDRKTKKTKVVHFYLKNTPTAELVAELTRAVPKVQQKIRNELVRRKVSV
jgi:hypothetical protein